MAKVLVVYHSLGGNTKKAAEIVRDAILEAGHEPVLRTGTEAGIDDLLDCAGLAIGTPDYFSYMAGGLKDFFDRTYYPSKGKSDGKPCFWFVTHGGGGRAAASVERMAESFKFKKAAEPVLIKDEPGEEEAEKLREAAGELTGHLAGSGGRGNDTR